jgi:hypothetical protein
MAGGSSVFHELLAAARAAGIEVRQARLGGSGGGLARLKQKRQLFVDMDADADEQLERTVSGLAGVDEVLAQALSPAARALLDSAREQ